MASAVETAVGQAVRSLLVRDLTLAQRVLEEEPAIDRRELAIDERCLRMLALYHPQAVDLRFLVMAFKIAHDLERLGDQAVNIAQRAQELVQQPPLAPLLDLPYLAELAQGMLTHSVDAFVRADAALARSVCRRDDQADGLEERIFRTLVESMIADHATIGRAVNLMLVSRHLERVADHATNIAEDVVDFVEGRPIKHRLGLLDCPLDAPVS